MYKGLIVNLSILWIALLVLFLAVKGEAGMVNLEELNLQYGKFMTPNRSAYFPQEQKDRIAIESKTEILTYGFFNTLVHGTSDDSQYRLIGLKFDLGIKLGDSIDLYYQHHSQHLLDTPDYYNRNFPVEDSINIKLYLYRR